MAEPPRGAGLCGVCRHAKLVTSGRGSVFLLCTVSRVDPRFPRYPPLPVLSCSAHERGTPQEAADSPPRE